MSESPGRGERDPRGGRRPSSDGPITVLDLQRAEATKSLLIRLSDGSSYEIAAQAPEARGLVPGSPVTPVQREGLRRAQLRKRLARRVFQLLGRRAYPRAVLRRKLLAASADRDPGEDSAAEAQEDLVEEVLDLFAGEGLVDDLRYARSWCEEQLRRKGVGRLWLRVRLLREGIDEGRVQEAVDDVLPLPEESGQAARALRKKGLDLEQEGQRARALRFLLSRGFSRSVALEQIHLLRSESASKGGSAHREATESS